MDGVSRSRTVWRAFCRSGLRSLVALGSFYLVIPEAFEALAELRQRTDRASVPRRSTAAVLPLGHPERLLPDLPLSALERELTEELAFLRTERPGE
ncbi:hypothetical protein OG226_44740 [Streptomyces sp. NBC_01261]|uniref:DUF6059 family protein n=1 Tax=unclassified Streptomyces TaxID=2593676 RepID=UPI002E2C9FE8|nr:MULTISPECIES: DUF6059 family protein [unclassified Streptomyces]